MQTIVALLLVAVAAVSASTFSEMVIRQKRSGSSPLGGLASVPVVGGVVGTVAGGAGGILGAGVAASGSNDQKAECAKTDCGQTACSAQSNTDNNAQGSGGVAGVGSLVGPININAPICPGLCLQCNQLGLATLGK